MLPGFTATWTDSFSSHPDVFLVLAALIMLGLWAGGIFECYVRDAMRPIWYGIPKTSPRTVSPPPPPAKINRAIQWLRTRKPYQWSFWFLTQRLLPGAFLVAVGYAAIAFVSQVTFAVRDSWGQVCASAGTILSRYVAGRGTTVPHQRALHLDRPYSRKRRHLSPAHHHPGWRPMDRQRPFRRDRTAFPRRTFLPAMSIGVLLRRHLGQPWLKPMAKIGVIGRDEYPLDPVPSLALDRFPSKPPQQNLRSTRA